MHPSYLSFTVNHRRFLLVFSKSSSISGKDHQKIYTTRVGAMPTQFNTKDSGRRTESLTAMTTHALQNGRFIPARMHRKRRHKPALDDTAVSVSVIKPAHIETETQTKASNKHSAFFCPPCNKKQQPHFRRIATSRRVCRGGKKCYDPTCLSCSKSSHVPSLFFFGLFLMLLV